MSLSITIDLSDADLAHVPSTSAEDVDGSRSAPAASREVA